MRNLFKAIDQFWTGKTDADGPNVIQSEGYPIRITLDSKEKDQYLVLCRNGDLDIIGISPEDYVYEVLRDGSYSTSGNALNQFAIWKLYRELMQKSEKGA